MPEELQPDGERIPPSPLIRVLRPDPNEPSNRVVLSGYPGPASIDKRVRLYLGLSFKSYYELNRADILHSWSADPGDPHAPILVAIESTTTFDLVVSSIPGSALSLLQGEIVSANLARAVRVQEFRRCSFTCRITFGSVG